MAPSGAQWYCCCEHQRRTAVKALFGTAGISSMTDGEIKIADDDDSIIACLRERYGG
jgi:hypothetical protein